MRNLIQEADKTVYTMNYALAMLIYFTAQDRKLDAIKHLRTLTGIGLRKCKHIVEAIVEENYTELPRTSHEEERLIELIVKKPYSMHM